MEEIICNIDEVGRGCLFSNVTCCACIIKEFQDETYKQIKDSKKLSKIKREKLEKYIQEKAIAYSYGVVEHDIIDEINILQATQKAFHISLNELWKKQHFTKILVDGNYFIPWTSPGEDGEVIEFECIIKGDEKIVGISCASILAKTYRDRMMIEYDAIYPEYDFKNNKGYGTVNHINAIKNFGLTELHRKTFVKKFTS
jgi:ribonuclease HII